MGQNLQNAPKFGFLHLFLRDKIFFNNQAHGTPDSYNTNQILEKIKEQSPSLSVIQRRTDHGPTNEDD